MNRFPEFAFISTAAVIFCVSAAAMFGHPSNAASPSALNQEPSVSPDITQEERPDQPKSKTFTPYDIEILILGDPTADLQDVWRRLGIKGHNGERTANSMSFLKSCHGCKAEMYEYDLDGDPGKEILLRIEDRLAEACRYLVFKAADHYAENPEDRWRFLGHIDHWFGRYRMPQHSVVVSCGKTWLLVEAQGGSGSGYAYYFNRLFKVSPDRLEELVSFPSEGHLSWCCYFPPRTFSSRVVNCVEQGGFTTLEVEFFVSYGGTIDPLWSKRQRAVYRTDPQTDRLTLDVARSDVTEREIEDVYANDVFGNAELMRYNFDELAEIARSGDRSRKEWLRDYLNQCEYNGRCKDLPHKVALERLLGQ